MSNECRTIRSGIVQFPGRISRHLLLEPMVSHAYLLEDGKDVILFDPSCGRRIAKAMEDHIRQRRATAEWKRGIVLAGHSHVDHANNFYLAEHFHAEETHVYLHERGFANGRVLNEPYGFLLRLTEEWSAYYNPYRAFVLPYSLITAPFAALHQLSPVLARRLFGAVGALPWPRPRNASIDPEPLRDRDLERIDLGGLQIRGWRLGEMVILPTPGHSPCSVSLYWPHKKAVFVSDADYIGNPMFTSCSMRDCLASISTLIEMTESGLVELLLPAHGLVRDGPDDVLNSLRFQLTRLQLLRQEVRAAYRETGVKDVHRLARHLSRESLLFRMLKEATYPRMVVFGHNAVAVCLREDGVLQ